MPVQAIKLKSSKETIERKAEEERDKGEGFFGFGKKPPEEVSYVRLLLLPATYFSFEYTTEEGFIRKKTVIRSSSAVFLNFSRDIYIPEVVFGRAMMYIARSIEREGLDDFNQGYCLPTIPDHEQFVEEKIKALTEIVEREKVVLDTYSEGSSEYSSQKAKLNDVIKRQREILNFDEDASKIQDFTNVKLFYIPYWIVKLENESTRYLVYDYEGDKHHTFAELLTSDVRFRRTIESEAEKVS